MSLILLNLVAVLRISRLYAIESWRLHMLTETAIVVSSAESALAIVLN